MHMHGFLGVVWGRESCFSDSEKMSGGKNDDGDLIEMPRCFN